MALACSTGTFEWAEFLCNPDEYFRALLRAHPDKQWTKQDLKNPEYMGRAVLLMHRYARENAPEGFVPFEVDILDYKAGLLLGLSEDEAIQLGKSEALRRVLKYVQIGIQKKLAEGKNQEGPVRGNAHEEPQESMDIDAGRDVGSGTNDKNASGTSTSKADIVDGEGRAKGKAFNRFDCNQNSQQPGQRE